MLLSNIPVHAGDQFTWNGREGTIEASDLGPSIHNRVYDDACDVGFYVKSHKTGERKLFVLDKPVVWDGETVAWVYKSAQSYRERDVAEPVKITVFND